MELLDLVVERTHYVIEGFTFSTLRGCTRYLHHLLYHNTTPLLHTTSPYTIHGGTGGYLFTSYLFITSTYIY